jgi:hypothetical protein
MSFDPAEHTIVAEAPGAGRAAWCAESVRSTDPGFRRACESHGLDVAEREVHESEDGRDGPVRITEVVPS